MIKAVLEHIGGVGLYGVISLGLFFAVFVGVCLRVARIQRAHADAMAALPLNDGETEQPQAVTSHDNTVERTS